MPIVTAIAVSINTVLGSQAQKRIEDAVNAEILKCNAEGISTEEKNSVVIRERMIATRDRVTAEIEAEQTLAGTVPDPMARIASLEALVKKLLDERGQG